MNDFFGVDVSYANGTDIAWDEAVGSGRVRFVFNRCTYGTNPAYDDGLSFTRNHDSLKALGIKQGAYHFYLFDQDGSAQAAHFLTVARGRYGELLPAVDVEEASAASGDGGSLEDRIANLAKFSKSVEQSLAKPIIYTNTATWKMYFANSDAFAGHILWVASRGAVGRPALPGGWTTAKVQQYGQGTLPGFHGLVDLDVLLGNSTLEELNR